MLVTEYENSPFRNFDMNQFYDEQLETKGKPPHYCLFDPQHVDPLDKEWILPRTWIGISAINDIDVFVKRSDLESMIAEGLIRPVPDGTGRQAFVPYCARQASVFTKLKEMGPHYSPSELLYVAECWPDYIEAVVMNPIPYEDPHVSEFTHYCRRADESLSFFQQEFARGPGSPGLEPEQATKQFDLVNRRLAEWLHITRFLAGKDEDTLTALQRSAIQRHLWHLRAYEEFVRLAMAERFAAQLLQRCDIPVIFNQAIWDEGDITLSDINWRETFGCIAEMRTEGRNYPIRLPHFSVTNGGEVLLTFSNEIMRSVGPPRWFNPEFYASLYGEFRIEEMFRVQREMSDELWPVKIDDEVWPTSQLLPGPGICRGCAASFEQQTATQKYCSRCGRERVKKRCWPDKDSERALYRQSRYWQTYFQDLE